MSTIPVTVEQMRELLTHARKIGTTHNWEEMAMEWMEKANTEIQRLKQLTKEQDSEQS